MSHSLPGHRSPASHFQPIHCLPGHGWSLGRQWEDQAVNFSSTTERRWPIPSAKGAGAFPRPKADRAAPQHTGSPSADSQGGQGPRTHLSLVLLNEGRPSSPRRLFSRLIRSATLLPGQEAALPAKGALGARRPSLTKVTASQGYEVPAAGAAQGIQAPGGEPVTTAAVAAETGHLGRRSCSGTWGRSRGRGRGDGAWSGAAGTRSRARARGPGRGRGPGSGPT